jgi:hypothetical protein
LPLRIGAKHLVRYLFLLVRHHVIQILKSRDELLYMLCMLLGELLIGLHVLHRVHRLKVINTLEQSLVHIACVIAHHLSELIPLRALSRGNAELRIQLFDPSLDPFLSGLARNRVPRQWRGSARQPASPSPMGQLLGLVIEPGLQQAA